MKYLEGIGVMLISNLLAIHFENLGVSMVIAAFAAVISMSLLLLGAHFLVNLFFPKRAEG